MERPPEFYYFDTSSLPDLEAYGMINHPSKVRAVTVPEIPEEIPDRSLGRRLKIAVDRGPQKRAAFVPGLDSGRTRDNRVDGMRPQRGTARIRLQRCRVARIRR